MNQLAQRTLSMAVDQKKGLTLERTPDGKFESARLFEEGKWRGSF